MKNNLIIAISGASHSGKTTFMEKMKEKYPNDIILLSEEIRDLDIGNIDEIRKDPIRYFKMEKKVIQIKMDSENKINEKYKDKVVLVDRSLVDSYFYYTFYMDKSSLPEEYQIKYHEFMYKLYENMKNNFQNLYDIIYFFDPITSLTRVDNYTQKNLQHTQINEYRHMLSLTTGMATTLDLFSEEESNFDSYMDKVKFYNAKSDYDDMEFNIKEFIKEKTNEY